MSDRGIPEWQAPTSGGFGIGAGPVPQITARPQMDHHRRRAKNQPGPRRAPITS